MAAFVECSSPGIKFGQFHVGTPLVAANLRKYWRDIILFQADGDELELAEKILGRTVSFRVFTFIGTEAQTIAVNWK